ncbi:hypothetical protein CC80DRAFT_537628 [Byssothecium circinans]|uniref:Uncharacterized protein n=1 Tax=Byssothecium circinans TaxID=147558 RepID=A0A6A5TP09_9PLEO|nr:hypothetical protein CC80DRAFT_537628 [Byssothecium circinans]
MMRGGGAGGACVCYALFLSGRDWDMAALQDLRRMNALKGKISETTGAFPREDYHGTLGLISTMSTTFIPMHTTKAEAEAKAKLATRPCFPMQSSVFRGFGYGEYRCGCGYGSSSRVGAGTGGLGRSG